MTSHYDLQWNRPNLAAMLVVCTAALICLGAMAIGRTVSLDNGIPIDGDRVAAARESIDPNSASIPSLKRLPGIGPAKAAAIVEYRGKAGPAAFIYAEDLTNVSGIGPGTVDRIRAYLSLPRSGDLR